MKVTPIPGRELSNDLVQPWLELQQGNPDLVSPFFHPEFTRIVASVRNDVQVAVIEDGGKVVAFFPFQKERKGVGKPVGHPLSDYHGLICAPNLNIDPQALLRACRLAAWDFDHLLVSQAAFHPYHQFREISPIVDLTTDFEDYISAHKASGSGFRRPFRLMRKLEREVGPLVFQSHVDDINLLNFIMQRKSEHYLRSNVPDLFAAEWIRRAVEAIFRTQTPDFGGMLSLLSAGSEIISVALSIRSSHVWHGCFHGFEDRFSSYSPGMLLDLKIVESGGKLGFRYFDLGKGDVEYKRRMMTGFIPVACGSIEVPSWLSFRREVTRRFRAGVTASPLAGPTRRVVQLMQRSLGTRT